MTSGCSHCSKETGTSQACWALRLEKRQFEHELRRQRGFDRVIGKLPLELFEGAAVSVDGRSNRVRILRRSDVKHLADFGYGGQFAGGLTTPHNLSVDSEGNLYVTESGEGKRVQRFLYTGLGPATLP